MNERPHCRNGLQCLAPESCICLCEACRIRPARSDAVLKLFVANVSGWGTRIEIVRACSAEQLPQILRVKFQDLNEVFELTSNGPIGVVWSYEDSPDTPRDPD